MTKLKFLIVINLYTVSFCFSQSIQGLSTDIVLDLVSVLKDGENDKTFCDELKLNKLGFFPTQEFMKSFRLAGASQEMMACLKDVFTNKLKFHVVGIDCQFDSCEISASEITRSIIDAIFSQKNNIETWDKFGRKQIVDYPKKTAKFENEELPTVYIGGTLFTEEGKYYLDINFKYQNEYEGGGQLIDEKQFILKSMKRRDIKKASEEVANWALARIENEVIEVISN